ncbi:related to NAN1 - U3 snoRNP protein [Pseudozyma flocculosa]|nr:related to NAN1 - U3 snoRNP protein [Pseudozyma flocculosa]
MAASTPSRPAANGASGHASSPASAAKPAAAATVDDDVEMSSAVAAPASAPGPKPKKKKAEHSGTRWSAHGMHWDTLVEGKMSDLPVVFTRDADYFFLASKASIKIYSRTTGQVVSTLSSDAHAHTATITGMLLNPSNPLQLITASLDGQIKVWDFLDGVLLKSLDVGLPITSLAAHELFRGMVFVAVRKPRHEADSAGDAGSGKGSKKKKAGKGHAGALDAHDDDPSARHNSIIYTVSLTATATKVAPTTPGAAVKPELLRIGKTREAAALGISPNGKWLVVIGNRKVQVARTSNLRGGFTKFVTAAQGASAETGDRLTCMAFHPTEDARLVTGDDRGRIRVWYCLDDRYMADTDASGGPAMERHAPSTVLHWHAHAVSSLAFTPNGAHLLSGGEEGVLVVWQLASSGGNGASKEFVPRLGAPISSIAIANGLDGREQEFALGLADGTVTFIGSMNLKPTRSFSRIKIDSSRHLLSSSSSSSSANRLGLDSAARQAALAAKAHGLALAIHPSTGNLVLPSGHPSSIQFYDAEKDSNAMELEIAPSNRVSRADDDPIEPTRVEKVVFSTAVSDKTGESGEWMVTFDSRNLVDDAAAGTAGDAVEDDGDSDGSASQQLLRTRVISESSLKFWRWDLINRRYVLNTRIDRPHNGKRLTSITFSPSSDGYLLVTTGRDGKIRTWSLTARALKSGRTESYWTCRSCFQYREAMPLCSSFSPDGSLLAVGQGSYVTFWQPETNLLQMTLSCPELRHRIKQIKFVGPNGRWVVVASARSVVVWDLVLGRVCWRRDRLGFGPLQRQLSGWSASPGGAEGSEREGGISNILGVIDNDKDASTFCLVINRPREVRTLVEVYQTPSSASAASTTMAGRPLERYAVDGLKLRQVISSSALSPSSIAWSRSTPVEGPPRAPCLIGFTQSYDLVRLGDASKASPAAGPSSSSIRGIGAARKTLFDDLFGPTLLVGSAEAGDDDDNEERRASALASDASRDGAGKGGIEHLFATPSHLLPPVTSLLDSFVDRVLPPRRAASTVKGAVGGTAAGSTAQHTAGTTVDGRTEADEGEMEVDEKSKATETTRERDLQKEVQDVLLGDMSFLVDTFRGLLNGKPSNSTSPSPSKKQPAHQASRTPNGTPSSTPARSGKKRNPTS